MKNGLLIVLLGLSLPVLASQPVADASRTPQGRAAADLCKTYVGYRLSHLMSLRITEVIPPNAPATRWIVVGEDKGQQPPVSFVCQLTPNGAQRQLDKLDLMQLAPDQPALKH